MTADCLVASFSSLMSFRRLSSLSSPGRVLSVVLLVSAKRVSVKGGGLSLLPLLLPLLLVLLSLFLVFFLLSVIAILLFIPLFLGTSISSSDLHSSDF